MIEKCAKCAHSGKDCIPRILSFPAADLLKWCKERKKFLDLSNAEIAENAKVPKGTIDRLFSTHEYTEFRFSTIQPVICVLTGCSPEDFDCEKQDTDSSNLQDIIAQKESIIKALEEKNLQTKERFRQMDERYNADISKARDEYKKTTDFLHGQVRYQRITITVLAVLFALTLALIIVALIVDRMNPDMGFFWLG